MPKNKHKKAAEHHEAAAKAHRNAHKPTFSAATATVNIRARQNDLRTGAGAGRVLKRGLCGGRRKRGAG